MSESEFNPTRYWESRLQRHWGPEAVGYLGLGTAYNRALYRVKGRVFRRVVERLKLNAATLDVLDVGSGTGFVVQQWQALGVTHLTGSDLSQFAVERLTEQYPRYRFLTFDIGTEGAARQLSDASFDCISALDVLYHIVDDGAYQKALGQISRLLRPGGYLLLADNFVHHATVRGVHQVSHSLDTLKAWLSAAHLEIASRTPQFVLMNYPVDSRSRLLHLWWRALSRQIAKSDRRGLWLGRVLAPLDTILTCIFREGPSTELAVCRRTDP